MDDPERVGGVEALGHLLDEPARLVGRELAALQPIGHTGLVYPIAAAVLGVVFLTEAHRLDQRARNGKDGVELLPMRLFHYSNMYLALLFVAAAVSPLVG